MYALERRVFLKTGHFLRYYWVRYGVSANRLLLERVRSGLPSSKDWRVVPMSCAIEDTSGAILKSA